MQKKLFIVSVLALSFAGFAAQAATCDEMFNKAEKMVVEKASASVGKKVKAYRMAIDSYTKCETAMAMPAGEKKTAMMKDAERAFDEAFSFARDIE